MEREVVESSKPNRDEKWSSVINTPRTLTHDEQKAAEAAFRHEPFNPAWSQAARIVYDGLVVAMAERCSPVPSILPETAEAILDESAIS